MKKYIFLLVLYSVSLKTQAQWITIPDTNFVAKLNQLYPQCMIGNLMDTTCNSIVSTTILDINYLGIYDPFGIQFFDSLQELHCVYNQMGNILQLPPNLTKLNCSYNWMSAIPDLPPTLTYLNCLNNGILSLPALPSGLIYLDCSSNLISNLPQLPNSLITLNCGWNVLDSLPDLPDSLQFLDARYLQLQVLPDLPNTITSLNVAANQLTYIDTIPSSLTYLNIYQNLITNLPPLPNSLQYMECRINQLASLPELPDALTDLIISFNPNLKCLPDLKNVTNIDFQNTGIQCFPNYGNISVSNPPIANYPLCDLFNFNGCDIFWSINGKVFADTNLNCQNDQFEIGLGNIKLMLYENGNLQHQTYTNMAGVYSFNTGLGNFNYLVDTSGTSVEVNCPVSGYLTSNLTLTDSMDNNMDFAMKCKSGFDVGVHSINRPSGEFFPGQIALVNIRAGDMSNQFGLQCASGISGSVIVEFNGPITYLSNLPGTLSPLVSFNTLTYQINDFGVIDFNSDFGFIVMTDTFSQAGDDICFDVSVLPVAGDILINNNFTNHCFDVVNSFDPNKKEVNPTGTITNLAEWLTYTIYFQNTGNAPAHHIQLIDTLSSYIDESTFTLLDFSHPNLTHLTGNIVKFNFPNINLIDSATNEPLSHGFIQYKVKPLSMLPHGTEINNKAYIYFDFNTPIVTNNVQNILDLSSEVSEIIHNPIIFYPNPANDMLYFKLPGENEITNISITDLHGRVVEVLTPNQTSFSISISNIKSGIYHIKFIGHSTSSVLKLVKL